MNKRYGVVWLTGAVRFEGVDPTISLGFCERTGSVAFVSLDAGVNALRPLVVDDVTVEDETCTDGAWCLSLDCEYNDTTYTSFRDAHQDLASALPTVAEYRGLRQRLKRAEEQLRKDGHAPESYEPGLMHRHEEPSVILG